MKITSERRPLMNYTGYSDKTWTTVEVPDLHAGAWIWGEGEYYDWCDANCRACYNLVKYTRNTVCGRFHSAADAMMFKLRWS